jgi:hypothetical protein
LSPYRSSKWIFSKKFLNQLLYTQGVKLTSHLRLVPRSRMRGAIPPLRQYAFMVWCLVKHRNMLTYSMVQNITWKAECHSAHKKISRFFYWTRRFITVFTKACHWTLSWANWIQLAPSIPISLRLS